MTGGHPSPAAMSKALHGARSSPYCPPPPPHHHQFLNWTPPQPPMPYRPNQTLLAVHYQPQPRPRSFCFAPHPSTGLPWNTMAQQPFPHRGLDNPAHPGVGPRANPTFIAHDQNTNFRTYRTSAPTTTTREETTAYHFSPCPDQSAFTARPLPVTSAHLVEPYCTESWGTDPRRIIEAFTKDSTSRSRPIPRIPHSLTAPRRPPKPR